MSSIFRDFHPGNRSCNLSDLNKLFERCESFKFDKNLFEISGNKKFFRFLSQVSSRSESVAWIQV